MGCVVGSEGPTAVPARLGAGQVTPSSRPMPCISRQAYRCTRPAMKRRLPLPRIALGLWLAVASQSGAAADDPSSGALPPTLITPAVLGAKITETEADPDLQAEAKTKLVALYREAVSNL
jgi:hypothetical protein